MQMGNDVTQEIVHGDCIAGMMAMGAESFDLCIADPPYGVDFQSGFRKKSEKLHRIENDKRPFIWWLAEAHRLLKRGGVPHMLHVLEV